jgi:hypothetical protein
MPNRCLSKTLRAAAVALAALVAARSAPLFAQDAPLPPVTIGAGLRTDVAHTAPDGGDATDAFTLDDIRLYVSGAATKTIKFMFNTAYNANGNDVEVLDAVAQIEFSPRFNVWFGRFLPPSDRANLYGPYYAHHWSVYTDGVQDGYPFIFQGRDNGAVYWGQFGKVKLSGGGFDGTTSTGRSTLIAAGRAQVDFWDPEPGYYLNGTYYGDKNILALGAAGQFQGSDRTAYNIDFLLERKVSGGGAFTVEAEWAKYDKLGGYNSNYGVDDGGYALGSYLFPRMAGPGRIEALGKYAFARFREGLESHVDYDQKTTELNLNYIIRQFNARVMAFYRNTRFTAVQTNSQQVGLGLQIQM